jgi:hypothetical protein
LNFNKNTPWRVFLFLTKLNKDVKNEEERSKKRRDHDPKRNSEVSQL